MKKLGDVLIGLAAVSLVVGVISRLSRVPVQGIFANAFLLFAGVCLLFSIALSLREK